MSHSRVFRAKFSGSPCSKNCGEPIKKGQQIIVTSRHGKIVSKITYIKEGHRWAHARCVFKKKENDNQS